MRELTIVEIRVSDADTPPVVVLAEEGGAERLLPIWMSHGGAAAILGATEEPDPLRPSIHDLFAQVLGELDEDVVAVTITDCTQGQFFAEVNFERTSVSSRASDAIALAMRLGCPIRCEDAVLDDYGISMTEAIDPDAPEAGEEEVERFREFLDTVTPEDFSGDDGKP